MTAEAPEEAEGALLNGDDDDDDDTKTIQQFSMTYLGWNSTFSGISYNLQRYISKTMGVWFSMFAPKMLDTRGVEKGNAMGPFWFRCSFLNIRVVNPGNWGKCLRAKNGIDRRNETAMPHMSSICCFLCFMMSQKNKTPAKTLVNISYSNMDEFNYFSGEFFQDVLILRDLKGPRKEGCLQNSEIVRPTCWAGIIERKLETWT